MNIEEAQKDMRNAYLAGGWSINLMFSLVNSSYVTIRNLDMINRAY